MFECPLSGGDPRCEPLEYSVPGDCECTLCQQLQETFEYSTTEEDGFLYKLLVRITLLAADSDVCLEWIDPMLYKWSSHTR